MCDTCGCSEPNNSKKTDDYSSDSHDIGNHNYTHGHINHDGHNHSRDKHTIIINQEIHEKNNALARKNRERFTKMGLFVINLISSPGSGKTLLLEKLACYFGQKMAVIEGDIQTSRDAERIIRTGSKAFQIMTRGACHLDAHAVGHALDQLDLTHCRLLVIENVGNLVCPSAYYLGEHEKFAVLSLPEGDDKILKYPALFSRASVLVINKIDLHQYLDFEIDKAINECRSLNNDFIPFCVSAKTCEGMDKLIQYIERKIEQRPLVC